MSAYDKLSVEAAERMSFEQWSNLPLSVQERIMSEYTGKEIRLSAQPHKDERKLMCPKGHLRSVYGVTRPDGHRDCRACMDMQNRKRAERRQQR